MAKLVVLSDSHTDVQTMVSIVAKENPDAVIHLGDHFRDAEQLSGECPAIQIHAVPGNTDSEDPGEEWIKFIEIDSKRLMLTHGHIFLAGYFVDGVPVHRDITKIFLEDSRCEDAEIILFGHTHTPYLNYRDGVWIMNPGRVGRTVGNTAHVTYGILVIDQGLVHWEIMEI